jgi:GTPase SAR1 family protein
MSTDSLHPNVQDLQQDVITLLNKIEGLMSRASNLLISDASGRKYAEFQKEVLDAKQNVEDLELVMAIVAPMKAGKSTIINAIVGQDILPSRASAMTTLPTEILLRSDEAQPVLVLDKSTLSCLKTALSTLQQKIQANGLDQAVAKMAKYPHLTELIPKIQDGFSIQPEIMGLADIKETLTDLNDIVRVCTVLDPLIDPLNQENFDVPCIYTPFWKATDTSQAKLLGNLVIVDTPGPNEAGENLRLSAVVADQLRRSSMVLIVLDFTQLNNKAAEEIKRQVQPVIRLLGKENLYVLVNKVDQRTEKDPMTSEKVKQFVLADLGLGESSDAGRVFEVAARWAFCAASFLSEMQHHPNIKKEEMKTARALAEQVFGIDWEEELEDCSLEQLQKKAQRLWKKSGFEPFLENAISVLMESAAPRCIKSALNLSRKRLEELRDDVQLRSSAIAKDEAKLRLEVGALEEDLEHLEVCRKRLKEVDKIKNKLQKNLEDLLGDLKVAARVSLEDYFAKEDYERGNLIQKLDIDTRKLFLSPLGSFELFPKWISERLKSAVEFKTSGIFEFDSEYRAEEFANQAVAYAQQRAESLLVTVRERTTQEVEKARSGLMSFLERETNPIIERARTRLNQSFNITLSLPPPVVDTSDDISVNRPRIRSQTKTVDQGYEDVTVKKRVWWHWLWIVPTDVTEKRKRPDKKVNYYTVSLNELIPEINYSIEASITAIGEGLNRYLDDDFQQRVDKFFASLDAYLSNYRDSLKQAQEDQQLAVEDKKTLIDGLNSIVPEATEQIKKCKTYAGYANSLLEK